MSPNRFDWAQGKSIIFNSFRIYRNVTDAFSSHSHLHSLLHFHLINCRIAK